MSKEQIIDYLTNEEKKARAELCMFRRICNENDENDKVLLDIALIRWNILCDIISHIKE